MEHSDRSTPEAILEAVFPSNKFYTEDEIAEHRRHISDSTRKVIICTYSPDEVNEDEDISEAMPTYSPNKNRTMPTVLDRVSNSLSNFVHRIIAL